MVDFTLFLSIYIIGLTMHIICLSSDVKELKEKEYERTKD